MLKKAVISAVNISARTADVYFVKSPNTIIKGIQLATTVTLTINSIGQKCVVAVFDESNPKDMVLMETYGSGGNIGGGLSVQITYLLGSNTSTVGGVPLVMSSPVYGTLTFSNGILVAKTP